MSSTDADAHELQMLVGRVHAAQRATSRAEQLANLAAASDRQALAARAKVDDGDLTALAAVDALDLRTAILEALAEVETARASRRPRTKGHRRIERLAGVLLDQLASRVTRDTDRPGMMRDQLHPILVRAAGADVAQIVLTVADALPTPPPPKPDRSPSDEATLF